MMTSLPLWALGHFSPVNWVLSRLFTHTHTHTLTHKRKYLVPITITVHNEWLDRMIAWVRNADLSSLSPISWRSIDAVCSAICREKKETGRKVTLTQQLLAFAKHFHLMRVKMAIGDKIKFEMCREVGTSFSLCKHFTAGVFYLILFYPSLSLSLPPLSLSCVWLVWDAAQYVYWYDFNEHTFDGEQGRKSKPRSAALAKVTAQRWVMKINFGR